MAVLRVARLPDQSETAAPRTHGRGAHLRTPIRPVHHWLASRARTIFDAPDLAEGAKADAPRKADEASKIGIAAQLQARSGDRRKGNHEPPPRAAAPMSSRALRGPF